MGSVTEYFARYYYYCVAAIVIAALLLAAIVIAALLLIVGCNATVSPDAIHAEVKAAVLSPEITTVISAHVEQAFKYEASKTQTSSSGTQTTSGKGWNIGSVVTDGGTIALAIVGAVGCFWIWRNGSKDRANIKAFDQAVQAMGVGPQQTTLLNRARRVLPHTKRWTKVAAPDGKDALHV